MRFVYSGSALTISTARRIASRIRYARLRTAKSINQEGTTEIAGSTFMHIWVRVVPLPNGVSSIPEGGEKVAFVASSVMP
jgi:hypothetical protein